VTGFADLVEGGGS